jgi:tRNA-dihydrouridine synthase 1
LYKAEGDFIQGLADWTKIKAVKEAVSIPVFANGNILYYSDIQRCLEATGADAVMSAEGNLYNPTIFASSSSASSPPSFSFDGGLYLPHADLALEYLDIVRDLKTRTSLSAVKGHLFKVMRPGLVRELDLREQLGKIRSDGTLDGYIQIVGDMKQRMDVSNCIRSLIILAYGSVTARRKSSGRQGIRGVASC